MGAIETMQKMSSSQVRASRRQSAVTRLKALASRFSWNWKLNNTRIALLYLTDEQLADIGVSRYEAEREARKISFF